MGISIHYKGRIGNPARVDDLRRDLVRFAAEAKWECLDLSGQDEFEILEMILYPPGPCEPVFFLFDSQGRLHPPYSYQADAKGADDPGWCSVKTQDGPLEAHVQVVELLSRIQRDYIPDLEVSDEGSYWEMEDLDSLRSARELLGLQMTLPSEALNDEADLAQT
jgi:hypothetical protein